MAKKLYEEWPKFKQVRHGVAIESLQRWTKVKEASGDVEFSTCDVFLRGFEYAYGMAAEDSNGVLGSLKISRVRSARESDGKRVLGRNFKASFAPLANLPRLLGVGHCRTWEEAVSTLCETMDVVSVIKEHGESIYKGGRGGWKAIRPIKVVYPWKDASEPNSVYSPFKLVGDYRLDETDHGCIAMHYAFDAKKIAEQYGANALVHRDDDDPEGQLRLYHRPMGQMTHFDVITIEQLYARVLAGSSEDGY